MPETSKPKDLIKVERSTFLNLCAAASAAQSLLRTLVYYPNPQWLVTVKEDLHNALQDAVSSNENT
jgi:hypothetical protein